MKFFPAGYYICEIAKAPEYLSEISREILSISGCIGNQHPDLKRCFFVGSRAEKQHYSEMLGLGDCGFSRLSEDTARLFENQLDIDRRFSRLKDALYFQRNYFSALDCSVVGIEMTKKYLDILENELRDSQLNVPLPKESTDGISAEFLGYDIIGWDHSGFHSFLCNSLWTELEHARFSGLGLLVNSYNEVERFAEKIQGMGEPVKWLPCRIMKFSYE